MAAAKKEQQQTQQQEPLYPAIEGFIEKASGDDVAALFKPLKDGLESLKGPKADQGKKVARAIERTEELLSYLLQVREKIEAERKGKGAARR